MPWALVKAYQDLRRRKIRSVLTVVGVIIGVAGIVAIVATSRNLEQAQRYNFDNATQADMSWWVWNNSEASAQTIAAVPNVAAVERRANYSTRIRTGVEWFDVTILGYDNYDNIKVNKLEFIEGRAPRTGEVAIEASARAVMPDLKIGDEIIYRQSPDNTEKRLTVSGFARSPSYPSASLLNFALVYGYAPDVRRMLGIAGSNEILVKVYDLNERTNTRRAIEDVYRKRNLQFSTYNARDPNNYLGKQELETLVTLLLAFSALGLIISGTLVANTLSAIVTEQIGEIGTLKALGGSRWQVLQVYLWAGAFYGLLGSAVGILLGFVLGKFLLSYLGSAVNFQVDQFFFQPDALWYGLAVGMGVTMLSALLPAWGGAGIPVRQALANYGISSAFGEGWIDRGLASFQRLPTLVSLPLRNLARRKVRNLITFGVVAISCAAFVAAQSASTSVDRTIGSLYDIYGADGWAQFTNRQNSGFTERLRTVEGVEAAEPWSRGRITLKAARADLWGVPPETSLYTKPVTAGRWFESGESNVALTTVALAAVSNLHIGDTIEIEVGRFKAELLIIGLLDDNSKYLGTTSTGKLFVPNVTAERILRHTGTSDFFAMRFTQHDKEFIDTTMRRVEQQFKALGATTLTAYSDKDAALQITGILQLLLYAMVAIIALIGAVGVINTLTLNVLERRREIGILRCLGTTNVRLLQIFLTEGLMIGLIGFVIGVALGYPLALLLVNLIGQSTFPLTFIFDGQMIAFTLAFALLLSGVASLLPAIGAAQVKAGTILRYG